MTNPVWVVTDVVAQEDYKLLVTFADQSKRLVNLQPILGMEVFSPLKNVEFFNTVKIEGGTVAWNDDIDIDPEYLYEHGKVLEPPSPEYLCADLIQTLINARKNKGWSQRDLAKHCGIVQPRIARMDRRQHSPQLNTLMRVAVALGHVIRLEPLNEEQDQ